MTHWANMRRKGRRPAPSTREKAAPARWRMVDPSARAHGDGREPPPPVPVVAIVLVASSACASGCVRCSTRHVSMRSASAASRPFSSITSSKYPVPPTARHRKECRAGADVPRLASTVTSSTPAARSDADAATRAGRRPSMTTSSVSRALLSLGPSKESDAEPQLRCRTCPRPPAPERRRVCSRSMSASRDTCSTDTPFAPHVLARTARTADTDAPIDAALTARSEAARGRLSQVRMTSIMPVCVTEGALAACAGAAPAALRGAPLGR